MKMHIIVISRYINLPIFYQILNITLKQKAIILYTITICTYYTTYTLFSNC